MVEVAGSPASPPTDVWLVTWRPAIHSSLTPAGVAALEGQAQSYFGALSAIPGFPLAVTASQRGHGQMTVWPQDAAAQQLAIANILSTAANVVPDPSIIFRDPINKAGSGT